MEWSVDVNDDARNAVRQYCIERNFKCRGCRYSIDKVTQEHSKYTTCIFANCPSTWSEVKED